MRVHTEPGHGRAAHRPRRTTEATGGATRATGSAGPAATDLRELSPGTLSALQRRVGNAAVGSLLAGRRGSSTGAGDVSRRRSGVHDVLRSAGRPLDRSTRLLMERRLGTDLSDVRLHTGAAARESASQVGARAYTSGNHVVIGEGGVDRHTLAHELTHVIQQRTGRVAGIERGDGLAISDPGDAFERAAEANARRAMTGTARAAQPDGSGRRHPSGAVVQRMRLPTFQLQVPEELLGDPDFRTFFEIRAATLNPRAVVEHPDPDSTERTLALIGTRGVDHQFLAACIKDYRAGRTGVQKQAQELEDPNVAGIEIELPETTFTIARGAAVENGMPLAQTAEITEIGLPVLELVVEGMDRLNGKKSMGGVSRKASIELVYGPLPAATDQDSAAYNSKSVVEARKKLRAALQQKGVLTDLLAAYNKSLKPSEKRYTLNPHAAAASLSKKPSKQSNVNQQTTVSVPYGNFGALATPSSDHFVTFFESAMNRKGYTQARTSSNNLASQINANWAARLGSGSGPAAPAAKMEVGPGVRSLLTHVLYQEAKFVFGAVDRVKEVAIKKHAFHVLPRLSPQDAVMSIIDDDEALLLLAWLVAEREAHPGSGGNKEPLADAVSRTLHAINPARESVLIDVRRIYDYLIEVLVTRLLAGRQLLQAAGPDRASAVFGVNREVARVMHVHPRVGSRVPITVQGKRYYMAVEQRSASHALNQTESDQGALIGKLQLPTG